MSVPLTSSTAGKWPRSTVHGCLAVLLRQGLRSGGRHRLGFAIAINGLESMAGSAVATCREVCSKLSLTPDVRFFQYCL